MLHYPGQLLTQTEVSVREYDVFPLLGTAIKIYQIAGLKGKSRVKQGADPRLSDLLIDALSEMELHPHEQRALLHVLQETRDCMFELAARRDAFG